MKMEIETTLNTAEIVEEIGVETFAEGQSNVENMLDTLPLMGKGMIGILLVTIIIIAGISLLNKIKDKPEERDSVGR